MSNYCYTCLSEDRELKPVESFYTKPMLKEWFKDSSFNVNVDHFLLCWECSAMIIKLSKFKKQVFKAQQIRLQVQQKKSARLVSQTKLCVYTKEIYDREYVFEEPNTEITQTKNKLSKRKERNLSKNNKKTKRTKRTHHPDAATKERNIYNITNNYFNDPKLFDTKKETLRTVSEAKEKTKRAKEQVIDLTEDPKLSSMPVVVIENIIDKELKQEQIDAYEAETQNKSLTPIFKDTERHNRPTVIMKVADSAGQYGEDYSKFTIVNLTEDEMHMTRELDRKERSYRRHILKCESCIIGFAEAHELATHNNEKHDELIGGFVCPVCATRFNNEFLFRQHKKTHYSSYKCRQCEFEHHHRYAIEMHLMKEHALTPLPVCSVCDAEFGTRQRLNAHLEKSHKETLKCNQCGQSFETVERLKDHATSHKEMDEVVEMVPCDACKGIFEGKAAYRAHVQCVHEDLAEQAYCEPCDQQFTSLKKIRHHAREHSLFDRVKYDLPSSSNEALAGETKRTQRMITHTCGLCKKGFSDEMRLKEHIQQKHPEVVPTVSDHSPVPSTSLQDVSFAGEQQSEVIIIEPEKDKSCPICSEGFSNRIELLEHLRTHKAEKHFKCDFCDKSFGSEMMLRKHLRTHLMD